MIIRIKRFWVVYEVFIVEINNHIYKIKTIEEKFRPIKITNSYNTKEHKSSLRESDEEQYSSLEYLSEEEVEKFDLIQTREEKPLETNAINEFEEIFESMCLQIQS